MGCGTEAHQRERTSSSTRLNWQIERLAERSRAGQVAPPTVVRGATNGNTHPSVAGSREIEDPPSGSAVPRVQLRRGVPFCVCVFIAARILLSMLGVVSVHDSPAISVEGFPSAGISRPIEAGWHNALDGTFRWDAGWFVRHRREGLRPRRWIGGVLPGLPAGCHEPSRGCCPWARWGRPRWFRTSRSSLPSSSCTG